MNWILDALKEPFDKLKKKKKKLKAPEHLKGKEAKLLELRSEIDAQLNKVREQDKMAKKQEEKPLPEIKIDTPPVAQPQPTPVAVPLPVEQPTPVAQPEAPQPQEVTIVAIIKDMDARLTAVERVMIKKLAE